MPRRVSTAKRYIYAGLVLLAAAFLAAVAASATYVSTARGTATLSISGTHLYPAASLALKAIPGLEPSEAKNLTITLACLRCPSPVRVALLRGAEKTASIILREGESRVLHAHGLDGVLIDAPAPTVLRVTVEARYTRHPFLWLSVPALAAALAGTGALSAGAVLRLSGLEEPEEHR